MFDIDPKVDDGIQNLVEDKDELEIDLLKNMIVFNPFERYNARECLEHPYFDDLRNDDPNTFIKSENEYDSSWCEEINTNEDILECINEEANMYLVQS